MNTDFKTQVVNDVIPFIERMLIKEQNHLLFLESNNAPTSFIDSSKFHLEHYKIRLQQYKDYVNVNI